MPTFRTAAAFAALALFMMTAAPMPQVFGPSPAFAQSADQLLADSTPLSSLDNRALQARIKALRDLAQDKTLPTVQRKEARTQLRAAREEMKSRREDKKQAGQKE